MPEPTLDVLHCAWSGGVGGAERAVHLLVREQARDPEVSPAVLFARGGPYAERTAAAGVPATVLEAGGAFDPRALRRAVAVMRRHRIHHIQGPEPLFIVASLLCRDARRVFTQRGGQAPGEPPPALSKRIRTRLLAPLLRRGFHAWSGNTRHGAQTGAKLFGLDPARMAVTYNGLDFGLLEPQRPADDVRRELGLEPSAFVVGTAANVRDWKRIDRLIEAAATVALDDLRVLVVGDGPALPGLKALARDRGVEDRVVWAGLQAHVGDYLQVMDAFALPSNDRESFGNAAVEAMARGLPTVVFADSGGLREHVSDGETGIVAADQPAFVEALRRLHADRAAAAELGARARDHVTSTYTPAAAAERYKALYRAALTDSK
jgi:glycosyltransferase involved in cell wall biosynthesis